MPTPPGCCSDQQFFVRLHAPATSACEGSADAGTGSNGTSATSSPPTTSAAERERVRDAILVMMVLLMLQATSHIGACCRRRPGAHVGSRPEQASSEYALRPPTQRVRIVAVGRHDDRIMARPGAMQGRVAYDRIVHGPGPVQYRMAALDRRPALLGVC